MVYSTWPPQTLLLSAIVCYRVNHPKKWLNWTMGAIFAVAMAMPVLEVVD